MHSRMLSSCRRAKTRRELLIAFANLVRSTTPPAILFNVNSRWLDSNGWPKRQSVSTTSECTVSWPARRGSPL